MTFVVISTFILVTVVIFLITLNSCFTIYLKFNVKVSSLTKNKYGTSESICSSSYIYIYLLLLLCTHILNFIHLIIEHTYYIMCSDKFL